MKTMLALVLSLLLNSLLLSAQESPPECLTLTIESRFAALNDTVYLPVTARSFQQILSLQGSLQWDTSHLTLVGVRDFGLPDLSLANFGINPAINDSGRLSFSWYDLSTLQGATVPDDHILFSVGFAVDDSFTETAPVRFTNNPTPLEIVLANESAVIPPVLVQGAVRPALPSGTPVVPIVISQSCAFASSADRGGSVQVVAAQGTPPFTYQWSGPNSFAAAGAILNDLVPGAYSLTLSDMAGESLMAQFQVGGKITDTIPDSCLLTLVPSYLCRGNTNNREVEITVGAFQGVGPYTFVWSTGKTEQQDFFSSITTRTFSETYSVTVTDSEGCTNRLSGLDPLLYCDTTGLPLQLILGSTHAQVGDTVCLPLRVFGFTDIAQLQFSLEWPAAQLQFLDWASSDKLPGLDDFSWNLQEAAAGLLGFAWQNGDSGISVPDGTDLLEVCFLVTAPPPATISINNALVPRYATSTDSIPLPLLFSNGRVTRSDTLTVSVGNALVQKGQRACLPVTIDAFPDAAGIQFALNWNPELVTFQEIIPGFITPGDNSWGTSQTQRGTLYFAWQNANPQGTLIEATTTLFSVCYTALADTGHARITFSSEELPLELVTSNLENPAVTGLPGTITLVPRVWPGDTNLDGEVNHFDLLPLGVAFAAQGPRRPQASTAWTPQPFIPWLRTTPNRLVDYAYIDTNGDGLLNTTDTSAINSNWTQQYPAPTTPLQTAEIRQAGAPLFVAVDTLYPGTQTTLPIVLGTEEFPATGVYGLGFTLHYSADAVRIGQPAISAVDSWLGTIGTDLLVMARDFPRDGKMEIALTRIDGREVTGYGPIARVGITIEDVIFAHRGENTLPFSITDIRLLNYDERSLPVSAPPTEAKVGTVTKTEDVLPANMLKLYPQPAQDWLHLESPFALEQLDIYRADGVWLDRITLQQEERIPVSGLPPGLYWLRATTPKGWFLQKFTIIR
ncbi:MAG: hypothetical protein H6555_01130 [Lewinellaceae bacterium]|nr:hypothetical protein [Lewinellaceae bacterium]